ncbi:MAG: DUF4157 domain-containing protein [Eubacterium sp.]|jgi:hypothetical protein|nr:DUF4157 domain-containing protein [Eubacterium sp.]
MLAYAKPEQKKKVNVQSKGIKTTSSSPNLTGIADGLKSRFETFSGFSFNDVRVHYNSGRPAQLQALAYTQGNQVYIASGQEKYLSHELGHVVQQKRQAIQPLLRADNININNDERLESEADKISYLINRGVSEVGLKDNGDHNLRIGHAPYSVNVVQCAEYWPVNEQNKPTASLVAIPVVKNRYAKRGVGNIGVAASNNRLYGSVREGIAAIKPLNGWNDPNGVCIRMQTLGDQDSKGEYRYNRNEAAATDQDIEIGVITPVIPKHTQDNNSKLSIITRNANGTDKVEKAERKMQHLHSATIHFGNIGSKIHPAPTQPTYTRTPGTEHFFLCFF